MYDFFTFLGLAILAGGASRKRPNERQEVEAILLMLASGLAFFGVLFLFRRSAGIGITLVVFACILLGYFWRSYSRDKPVPPPPFA